MNEDVGPVWKCVSRARHERAIVRHRSSTAGILWTLMSALLLGLGQLACAEDASLDAIGVQPRVSEFAWSAWRAESPHDALLKLAEYVETLEPGGSTQSSSRVDHGHAALYDDDVYSAHLGLIQPVSVINKDDQTYADFSPLRFGRSPFSALRISVPSPTQDPPQSNPGWTRVAEADNAFDALREFLQKRNGSAPVEKPTAPPPPIIVPQAPTAEPPLIAGTNVGSNVCLGCHLSQAEMFGFTLMGRLQKQGKLQCETCHGPGSAHVRAVGCAACHGDGGITTRPGIPSLVGQDPQYLVAAMKAYISGQRKHAMMKTLLSGRSDAEINNIAFYYARQPSARAQTPLVGNPSAGKAATAICAACHGDQGVSVSPAFPSLAGQDAQYLADAIEAYKTGERNKTVACAAVSRRARDQQNTRNPKPRWTGPTISCCGDEGLHRRAAQECRYEGAPFRCW